MWTPTALASEARPAQGIVWRAVEHQYSASTRKIVDTQAEQDLLETLLEASKPAYPPGTEALDYLLKTPFRYYPPKPHGSRFRRAHAGAGVFYASEQVRTALAELTYYRYRFFLASPGTPLPRAQERLTVFSAKYATSRSLDLTRPPLDRNRAVWTHPSDYSATQALADAARQGGIAAIRYESVRDAEKGANLALLDPAAFAYPRPLVRQTWFLYLGEVEATCVRAQARLRAERWTFARSQFAFSGAGEPSDLTQGDRAPGYQRPTGRPRPTGPRRR